MSAQHILAGLLTAIGIIGLAIAPLEAPSVTASSNAEVKNAAIAISLGSQLRLDQAGHANAAVRPAKTSRTMVCGNVFGLAGARIGLSCRTAAGTQSVALAN